MGISETEPHDISPFPLNLLIAPVKEHIVAHTLMFAGAWLDLLFNLVAGPVQSILALVLIKMQAKVAPSC